MSLAPQHLAAALLAALIAPGQAAPSLAAPAFSWEAPLAVPPDAGLARVVIPGPALAALRSPHQGDLRIFNGAGHALVLAYRRPAPAAPPDTFTAAYAAHRLLPTPAASPRPTSTLQIQIQQPAGQPPVSVQIQPAPAPAPTPGDGQPRAALFDTRQESRPIDALEIQGQWPPNTPVRLTAAVSTDLARWTPVSLAGAVYRFDGESGPDNRLLTLPQPLALRHQYLRLEWHGAAGVQVTRIRGRHTGSPAPQPVRVELPPARAVNGALEWYAESTSPVSALHLALTQPNTILPLRLLGRTDPSQAWLQLAQTRAFRVSPGGVEITNDKLLLAPQPLRWIRLEALHGRELDAASLQASVGFAPLELVFAVTGSPPYRLVAGRPRTPSVDIELGEFALAAGRTLDELPLASLGQPVVRTPARSPWSFLVPHSPQAREFTLWGVLLAGVALLAAVAWQLLRQLKGVKSPT